MFLDTRLGNVPRWFLSPPKDFNMRIDDCIRECVVFVGRVIPAGCQEQKRLTGTAFIVRVPTPDALLDVFYLVTAKHVADGLAAGGEWFVRYNTKCGGCTEARSGAAVRWWTHPDSSVDAAVTPLPLPPGAQHTAVPVGMFATEKAIADAAIGAGSDVFVPGLFTKMTGRAKNIPLLRMGNVAMLPDERVPNIRAGGDPVESEVYLIEMRSLGGLSGSPVFVTETLKVPVRDATDPDGHPADMYGPGGLFFLGLMSGHWLIMERDANEVEMVNVDRVRGSIATGLSICVPAKKILEILKCPELTEMRRAEAAAWLAAHGTTTHDSAGGPA